CALGDLPFLKIGSNLDYFHKHPHPLTIVKNIWDCPPCKICGEICMFFHDCTDLSSTLMAFAFHSVVNV
ncbi:hypothetical protein Gotur_004360, partial [Gossypium turneri]